MLTKLLFMGIKIMNLAVYNSELQVGDLTLNEESQTNKQTQETNERNAESCQVQKLVEHYI